MRHFGRGDCSAKGAARIKGAILSRERMAPLNPQENAPGGPPPPPPKPTPPSTPDIGSLDLEKLLSLRNRVQCTWLRHEPLLFVTTLNRALLS